MPQTEQSKLICGLVALASILAVSCAEPKAAPEILTASPARIAQQLDSEVTVEGRNFFTEVGGALESEAPFIDRGFDIRIAGVPAAEVLGSSPQQVEFKAPANLPLGLQPVSLTTPGGLTAELSDAVTVSPVELRVETAPGGTGETAVDTTVQLGMSLTFFSLLRFDDEVFFRDEPVTWSITGNAGTLSGSSETSTTFTPTGVGVATLTASHPVLGDLTLTLTVRRCMGDNDCVDACHSVGSCEAGECSQGPADKDLDGDGFIDAACEGGSDCNDNPETCGANCFPGNAAPDGCDGFDQECDGEIDEDPDIAWYEDKDGDGFGAPSMAQITCNQPLGLVANDTDCDDDPQSCGALCSPALDESLDEGNCADGLDNDCDTAIDDLDRSCIEPNTPPTLVMAVTPGVGTTTTNFGGVASATDLEDASGSLVFEWDWDGDGSFEASGTNSAHTFAAEGRYVVTARVRDTEGLESWALFEVSVVDSTQLVTVTTAADESDNGATPAMPGGAGLSLREALAYSATEPGEQSILMPSGIDTTVGSTIVVDGDSFVLFADGASLTCNGGSDGLRMESNNSAVFGLVVDGCQIGVRVVGTGNRTVRVRATNNNTGVQTDGAGNTVGPGALLQDNNTGVRANAKTTIMKNRILGSRSDGIQLSAQADGSQVWGNTLWDNRSGIVLSGARDALLQNNTVVRSVDHGVQIRGGARGVTLQCNILNENGRHGLQAGSSDFTLRSHNNFFGNGNGACTACSVEASSSQLDPEFIDASNNDLRLSPFSSLIDGCPDLGLDVNGAEPDEFNGGAPDIGGWESPY